MSAYKEEKLQSSIAETSDFYNACAANDIPRIKWYLARMTANEINNIEPNNNTALHAACYHNNAGAVYLLLRFGALGSIQNSHGLTPFEETTSPCIKQLFLSTGNAAWIDWTFVNPPTREAKLMFDCYLEAIFRSMGLPFILDYLHIHYARRHVFEASSELAEDIEPHFTDARTSQPETHAINITNISALGRNEEEVLLMPLSTFRIIDINFDRNQNLYNIALEDCNLPSENDPSAPIIHCDFAETPNPQIPNHNFTINIDDSSLNKFTNLKIHVAKAIINTSTKRFLIWAITIIFIVITVLLVVILPVFLRTPCTSNLTPPVFGTTLQSTPPNTTTMNLFTQPTTTSSSSQSTITSTQNFSTFSCHTGQKCEYGTLTGLSSPLRPYSVYKHTVELHKNIAQLWWTVNDVEQDITFELHVKTTGWIALGISPAGGMKGADIAIGWVDFSGKSFIQDRFAFDKTKPVIDNTTQDWFILRGQEQNGWTAVQFKRAFDSCDPMDVPIRSGTNILIYAYGLVDPDTIHSEIDIMYHGEQRGTRILPLRSYSNQATDDILTGLDFFDFRFENLMVPSTDTTYYCKVFKSPTKYHEKRHAIAHEILIDSRNKNLLHHLDLFECNSMDILDDTKLPDGICDNILTEMRMCSSNLATAWAIGADVTTLYPQEAGYAVTSDTDSKYFMIKIHYDNPQLSSNLRDSSGIRFYLGKNLRPNDLGYLLFGTLSNPASLALPPNMNQFIVDSYCPSEATRNFPASGVNIVSALPHTHLQGYSVWTKLIRNNTAIQYLFNAEAFDFNHQFANQLPKPIKVYPGDSFATRCVYNTKNKRDITLGGQRTIDEMCSHTFSYYPLVDSLSACMTRIDMAAWQIKMNMSTTIDNIQLEHWLLNLTWTSQSADEWQEFYNKAQRIVSIFKGAQVESKFLPALPKYEDLKVKPCYRKPITTTTNTLGNTCDSLFSIDNKLFFLLCIFLLLIQSPTSKFSIS
ncbi:hypothetical protein I4U23_004673 [Adineta vaga]|nr:hypothetical protein I4U23_004673 [Adineta vaga]